ncbi:acyl--CoA ligase [Micromonospora ureilytica]|uniref:class I adenylate-forming enzyme family protein n=1 Tax=Micromonospora ureilytica TaxID=709868 RepID=UPI002E12907B|nr:acyl--CoA ligase [Micromonospora ureilytica]
MDSPLAAGRHDLPAHGTGWVDDVLLAGPGSETCLVLGAPITRAQLRAEVTSRQARLTDAGLRPGGAIALRLPSSLAYVANLLAAWRIGAQVTLLDHRLSRGEVERALERVGAQFLVQPAAAVVAPLRGFVTVDETVVALPAGRPAPTSHALIQLSSGSTGPSKVIGRTVDDLVAEIERYTRIDGVPRPGERLVLLASMAHVLGLVGGLLYALHARVRLTLPERMTVGGVLGAITAESTPTTVIGVPVHLEMLMAGRPDGPLSQFVRMTTAGELVRPGVRERFATCYDTVLANMYGMTEVGVIATDLFGAHRPGVRPAPGIDVRVVDGELQVRRPVTPYVGLVDESRWSDGWLRTRDAASLDPVTGLVTIRGRLDSQVSIGGLKVDLTEVEQAILDLPGVTEVVVTFDGGAIEAYTAVEKPWTGPELDAALEDVLAPYKRPLRWQLLERLPRTSSGKVVRDVAVLRRASAGPTPS